VAAPLTPYPQATCPANWPPLTCTLTHSFTRNPLNLQLPHDSHLLPNGPQQPIRRAVHLAQPVDTLPLLKRLLVPRARKLLHPRVAALRCRPRLLPGFTLRQRQAKIDSGNRSTLDLLLLTTPSRASTLCPARPQPAAKAVPQRRRAHDMGMRMCAGWVHVCTCTKRAYVQMHACVVLCVRVHIHVL